MEQCLAPVVMECQAVPDNKDLRVNLASPSQVPKVNQGQLDHLENVWQTQHVAKGPGVKLVRVDHLDREDNKVSRVIQDLKEMLGLLGRLVQLAQAVPADLRDLRETLD